MIMTIDPSEVKSGMLKSESNVQEMLRALYFYGTDYIMLISGKRERLIHKEQLVALLEQGREQSAVSDMMSAVLSEPLSARMQIEDIPPAAPLLVFDDRKESGRQGLFRTTFEAYREDKIKETDAGLPEWWGVPLPLIHIGGDRVFMNENASETVPCDAGTLARQVDRILRDRIVTVKDKKREKTYSLQPLAENTFLLEDVSGDFEMAEELVWWAAAGRAFFRRLEENGALVRRVSPYEDPPKSAAEVIPCIWEGEHIGSLAIELREPGPDAAPDPVPASEASGRGAKPGRDEAKVRPVPESAGEGAVPSKVSRRPGRGRKYGDFGDHARDREISASPATGEEMENDEALMKLNLEAPLEGSGGLEKLSKNAARKAYGGAAARRAAPDGKKA
ncbi:MAG: hypothetical protein LBR87_04440 [Synergistaceae bacterium]|jgi:hypothetical protein|nr:hypothetical protein [Synergistaceae bacterium]